MNVHKMICPVDIISDFGLRLLICMLENETSKNRRRKKLWQENQGSFADVQVLTFSSPPLEGEFLTDLQ